MEKLADQFIWVEKYRPQKINDCILPDSIKKNLKEFIKQGKITHLMFCGSAGTGKTTAAKAICKELGCDMLFINASQENGIDTVRVKIQNFASTVSLSEAGKIIILDEVDGITPAAQSALRAFMEEFANNCQFILTCNFKNKIIEPIHSRCSVVDFIIPKKDKPELAKQLFIRIMEILKEEKVKVETPKVLAELITRYYPDNRKIINTIQRYAAGGTIDSGLLAEIAEIKIEELVKILREKNFTNLRRWIVANSDNEPARLFRSVYDAIMSNSVVQNNCIPKLVLIIADYLFKSYFVADQEINTVACLTEVMSEVEFK